MKHTTQWTCRWTDGHQSMYSYSQILISYGIQIRRVDLFVSRSTVGPLAAAGPTNAAQCQVAWRPK